jgi:hypothetical protein
MPEIIRCEQQLGRPQAELVQTIIVTPDEMCLSDGGRRLEMGEVVGAPLQAQKPDPRTDGATGDEHHLAAGFPDEVHLFGERVKSGFVQRVILSGKHVGSHFDHNGAGTINDSLANVLQRIGHDGRS